MYSFGLRAHNASLVRSQEPNPPWPPPLISAMLGCARQSYSEHQPRLSSALQSTQGSGLCLSLPHMLVIYLLWMLRVSTVREFTLKKNSFELQVPNWGLEIKFRTFRKENKTQEHLDFTLEGILQKPSA